MMLKAAQLGLALLAVPVRATAPEGYTGGVGACRVGTDMTGSGVEDTDYVKLLRSGGEITVPHDCFGLCDTWMTDHAGQMCYGIEYKEDSGNSSQVDYCEIWISAIGSAEDIGDTKYHCYMHSMGSDDDTMANMTGHHNHTEGDGDMTNHTEGDGHHEGDGHDHGDGDGHDDGSSTTPMTGGDDVQTSTYEVGFSIEGADYDALAADQTAYNNMKTEVAHEIADMAGVADDAVTVELSSGSIAVLAEVVAPAGMSTDTIVAQIDANKQDIIDMVTTNYPDVVPAGTTLSIADIVASVQDDTAGCTKAGLALAAAGVALMLQK